MTLVREYAVVSADESSSQTEKRAEPPAIKNHCAVRRPLPTKQFKRIDIRLTSNSGGRRVPW